MEVMLVEELLFELSVVALERIDRGRHAGRKAPNLPVMIGRVDPLLEEVWR